MIDKGKLVLEGELDDIKAEHQLLTVQFAADGSERPTISGLLSAQQNGNIWNLVCSGSVDQVHQSLQAAGGEVTNSRTASLNEIFVARVGRDRLQTIEAQ